MKLIKFPMVDINTIMCDSLFCKLNPSQDEWILQHNIQHCNYKFENLSKYFADKSILSQYGIFSTFLRTRNIRKDFKMSIVSCAEYNKGESESLPFVHVFIYLFFFILLFFSIWNMYLKFDFFWHTPPYFI